jgi:hypothetical protein
VRAVGTAIGVGEDDCTGRAGILFYGMRVQTIACRWIGAAAVFGGVMLAGPAFALQLITATEAALPPDHPLGAERGISRGPSVMVVSPQPGAGTIKSPLALKIRFISHGNTTVDVNSVLVTYMRIPAVDLTQRIKPDISAGGIDVEDAEVPPGTHTLRVNVMDSDGHTNSTDFTFSVSQ